MAQRIAIAASWRAPDHGKLMPWRAVVVGDREREALRDLFARFAREVGKTDEDVAIERDRADNGPVLVAWIVRIDATAEEVPPHLQTTHSTDLLGACKEFAVLATAVLSLPASPAAVCRVLERRTRP